MATLDRPSVEYKTPADLVRDVQRGVLRVPPFQRGFRWEPSDVTKLFDSLYRGFPIGNLLLWRRSAPAQRLPIASAPTGLELSGYLAHPSRQTISLRMTLQAWQAQTIRS